MTWLVWRQHRKQLLSAAAALAGTPSPVPAAFSTVSRRPCSTRPFISESGALSTAEARISPGRTSIRPSSDCSRHSAPRAASNRA